MMEDFRLKVFLEVARTGSFTVAAAGLGISQPAVSQNVTTLERLLGVRLFERTKGEAVLSAEGRAFQRYAENILYWYDAANGMFGPDGRMAGNRPVRIAADDVTAEYLLPPVLGEIYASHPGAVFSVSRLKEPSLMPSTVFEEPFEASEGVPGTHFGAPEDADVEISVSPSPKTMDFEGESRLVGVMEAAVVVSSGNRSMAALLQGSAQPFSTLSGVHISSNFALWSGYSPLLTPDVQSRVSYVSDSAGSVKALVADSPSLVGILPAFAVRKEISLGTLVRLPVQLPEFTFDIHFNPLPEFANRDVCILLRETLKNRI